MFNKEKILEIINQDGFFIDEFLFDAFIKNWKIEAIYEDENGVEYFDEMTIEKIKDAISQKNPANCEVHILDKTSQEPPSESVSLEVESAYHEQDVEHSNPEQDIESVKPSISQEQSEYVDDSSYERITDKNVIDENIIEQVAEPVESVVEPVEVEHSSVEIVEREIQAEHSVQSGFPVQVRRDVENSLQNVTVDISNQTLAVLAESIARKISSDVSSFLKDSDFVSDAVRLGEVKKDNEILIKKIEELLDDNKILVQRINELESENDSFVKLFGNVYIKNV